MCIRDRIKTDILEMFMEANEGRDLRDRGNVKAVTRKMCIRDRNTSFP